MLTKLVRQLNKCYDLKVALQRNIFTPSRLSNADKSAEKVKVQEEKVEENPSVIVEKDDKITLIGINRPEKRNAINAKTGDSLCEAFRNFENDETSAVAVLYGKGGSFCSGYDIEELGDKTKQASLENLFTAEGSVGPTRRHIAKPVICAINGYCVANGLELALMCDLRVMEDTACMGFFNRRLSIPLIDGGTARLAAIIGFSRALDLILTGRVIDSKEALQIGLVNRVVACGTALGQAVNMAYCIAKYPQVSIRHDRNSLYSATFDALGFNAAIQNEIMLTSPDIMNEMEKGVKAFNECDDKGPKSCSKLYQDVLPEWEQLEINYEKQYEEILNRVAEKRRKAEEEAKIKANEEARLKLAEEKQRAEEEKRKTEEDKKKSDDEKK